MMTGRLENVRGHWRRENEAHHEELISCGAYAAGIVRRQRNKCKLKFAAFRIHKNCEFTCVRLRSLKQRSARKK